MLPPIHFACLCVYRCEILIVACIAEIKQRFRNRIDIQNPVCFVNNDESFAEVFDNRREFLFLSRKFFNGIFQVLPHRFEFFDEDADFGVGINGGFRSAL